MTHVKNVTLAEIAANLGLDPKNARMLPIQVKVEPYEDAVTDAVLAHLAEEGVEEAAGPVTESGKPRMLKLSAWIAHAGPANKNGDAFLQEDLSEVAANGLFAPPYLGMVDFNHDFNAYGAWFSARYEFDPIANQYGLRAEGSMFAWRYTDMADKILAEQAREGSIAVSMACICQAIETRMLENGQTEDVLRKPVFLTVSLLDVPPADPHGRAVGTESEDSTVEERIRQLNTALFSMHAADGMTLENWVTAQQQIGNANQNTIQEDTMDLDQIIAKLTEVMGEQAEVLIASLQETLADAVKVPALEVEVARLTTELATANETLEATSNELDASKIAYEAKVAELSALTVTHEAVAAELAELVSNNQAVEYAAKRTERLDALPGVFVTILEAREEESREKAVTRLVEMSDEEFALELELLTAGSSASYTDRSHAEGKLTGVAGGARGGLAIDEFIN